MNEKTENPLNSFEWHLIASKEQWFDELEHRLFLNATNHEVKVGFGHNTRQIEIIAIAVEEKETQTSALEGEIIEGDE